ncbi:hypothetical protein LSCM1_00151 [Leishmania martiniquensis]|uniref:Uncharacterized protein n=1 Tax=Leishmania martiniquensis TaxID=1580590 RepID=A0A836GSM8_9TRYP|nr:hypothetical protein LSCM1_00151 [Leishmania martiniquensis]
MFFRRHKSAKESGKALGKATEKASHSVKKGLSEASVKIESHPESASLHKTAASSPRTADFEKPMGKLTGAAPAPTSAAECSHAASAHSEHADASTAHAVPTASASRPRAVICDSAAHAVFSARTNSEGHRATIPVSPLPTARQSGSPAPETSRRAAEGAAHSRVASGQSGTPGESIVFSLSDSIAGTSIQFATDSAAPEHVLSGEASVSSRASGGVKKSRSPNMGAQRSPAEHNNAGHHAAALSAFTSPASLDIRIEDGEQLQESATKVAAAAVEGEGRHPKHQSSQSHKMQTSGTSTRVPSSRKREVRGKLAEAAGGSTRHATYPALPVDLPLKGSRTPTAPKTAAPATVRPSGVSRDDRRALNASRQKTKTLRAEQQYPSSSSRGRGFLDPSLSSSRSWSGGSADHREPRDTLNSGGEESAEHLPRRVPHQGRRLRLIPGENGAEGWSVSSAEGVSERELFRHHRDATADAGESGRSSRARSGKASRQQRHTDPGLLPAGCYRSGELAWVEHRRSSSRRPMRYPFSQHVSLENLDGGALVHECLMEVMKDGGEGARTPHHSRQRRRSGNAIHQRSLTKHINHSEGERYYPLRGSISAASSVSPVERHRKGSDDGNAPGGENRARRHRYRSNGSPLHPRWHFSVEREARATSPLYADPGSSHRISFYDDDTNSDLYSASAVPRREELRALPDRPRSRRSRGRQGDWYGSAVGQSARSAITSVSGEGDSEYDDELRSSLVAHGRGQHSLRQEDADVSPWSKEHRAGSRPRQAVGEEYLRRHYEGEGTSELQGSQVRAHRRQGSQFDDSYHCSGVPRRLDPLYRDGHSRLEHSRSYLAPYATALPACDSPRRHRRGTCRQDLNAGAQPSKAWCPSLASPASSPVRGRRTRRAASINVRTPLRRGSRNRTSSAGSAPFSEKELLEEVEWKLDVLEQQIADEDAELERAMMRSPFERLYHLNNRRDRDERRKKVFHLNRLERIRDQIISGSLEEALARKEERLRKQQEMLTSPNGVFMRLYHCSSARRSSADVACAVEESGDKSARGGNGGSHASGSATADTTAASGKPTSTGRSRMSEAEFEALGKRLYECAAITKRKKEEMAKHSLEERQRRQAEELLIARLAWQIQLERARSRGSASRRPQTPAQLEEEARAELKKLREEDPEGYEKKVLRGRVLSEAERDMNAARLSRQGYISKGKLEAQKKVLELKNCTFHPVINAFPGSVEESVHDRSHSKADHRHSSGGTDGDEHLASGAYRARPHAEERRCALLYRKAMQAKERGEALRDQRDRETRLRILRSRMASDHHFRRRVELDPSLAERFMKSLVV